VIHKTAIIEDGAKISKNVEIGAYTVIGHQVTIDSGTRLHSHVNIKGNTKIGSGNEIFPFTSIGNDPQDLKYQGEENSLIIGNDNKIREYVNINPGTKRGGGITKIGNNNLFIPPPRLVPGFIFTYSLILLSLPIINEFSSPWYFKS
jgi:UDP-N-acetylglucosamine acyltransferase